MTQPLPLSVHALSKASNPSLEVLSQPLGRADEMSEAALLQYISVLIDHRAITDQDPRPVTNELHKRGLRALGMDLEGGHLRLGHHPQPMAITVEESRGLVNVVHREVRATSPMAV
jgi:hypothetical protein